MLDYSFLCALLGTVGALYYIVIQPLCFSPLRRIPNAHWSAPYLPLWIAWKRYEGRENATVLAAHRERGPIIRLGPGELSINSMDDGFRTVYGGTQPFLKHDFYKSLYCFDLPNLASMQERHAHTVRRRAMSALYSKSNILQSKALAQQTMTIIRDRLLPILETHSVAKNPVDMQRLMVSTPTDMISAFLFGLSRSTNLLSDAQEARLRMRQYHIRYFYAFFFQEYLTAWKWLRELGWNVIPKEVDNAGSEIGHWILAKCDGSEQLLEQNFEQEVEPEVDPKEHPLGYAHLRTSIQSIAAAGQKDRKWRPLRPDQRNDLASEMVDATFGGLEVSAIPLSYAMYHLAKDHEFQEKLRKELQPIFATGDGGTLADPLLLDQAPILHATLMETLRLYPPLAGGLARVSPNHPVTLCGYPGIPPGTRVSARCYCLHRNPEVFPEPETWRPDRWLTADGSRLDTGPSGSEMRRWWWAFGSASRQCLGLHLAQYVVKMILGSVVAHYKVTTVNETVPVPLDGFIGNFTVQKLDLRVEKVV